MDFFERGRLFNTWRKKCRVKENEYEVQAE